MSSSMVRVLVAAMAVAALASSELAMAVNYDVGDQSGWTLGVDYTTWAADKKFSPGDNITFTYSSSSHDVVEVNAADYAACSASNPISTSNTGKTTIPLVAVGKRYFYCGISNHCARGMKVEIDVVATSSKSPSPSSSSPADGPSSPSASGSSPSSRSSPAPSAAARITFAQAKAPLSLGILAVAAAGLVM